MIPYSRLTLKLSDLYTLSQSEQLENHTLLNGTYLYTYVAHIWQSPPPGGVGSLGYLSCIPDFRA